MQRVKNQLDPWAGAKRGRWEDSIAATGYRDVGLNLRVTSEEARERGVDGHVAEVSNGRRECHIIFRVCC